MKEFTIGQNDAGQRLDKFLGKAVPLLPSSAAVQKGLIISRRTGLPAQGFHQSFDLIGKVQSNVHAPVRVDGNGLQQLD